MPTIEFQASPLGPAVTADEPGGGRLLDICDDAGAAVPFSCRSASCGTCQIDVIAGAELLEPPGSDEQEILAIFDGPPSRRLACVARVYPGGGRVVLQIVGDGSDAAHSGLPSGDAERE